MIVLDASVLIGHVSDQDAHHRQAGEVLRAAGDRSLVASAVTLAEVLVMPAREGVLDRMTAVLEKLGVAGIALEVDDAPRLARLRADTGLRLPDCCVLLIAERNRAALATFDDRLGEAARRRGVDVIGF